MEGIRLLRLPSKEISVEMLLRHVSLIIVRPEEHEAAEQH
jgi:hypothetical protein